MSIKISDAQRSMLEAAALRGDRLLPAPTAPKGAAARAFAKKLIAAGLVKEIKARNTAPIWRRDRESGQAIALKLTPAGMEAVATRSAAAVVATRDDHIEADKSRGRGEERPQQARRKRSAAQRAAVDNVMTAEAQKDVCPAAPRAPRVGSKLSCVLELLRLDGGATLAELTDATGWLPHTTRAALTGLRKRGFTLRLLRAERGRASTYQVVVPAGERA